MNTPEQLPEGSSLKDAGRKIREIITYLRSLRLTAGQGIRLDHYAAGTTISLSHTPAPTGKSSANEYTGGFRLVDMSEVVTEEGEDGKETEKVIPKLGVLGVNREGGANVGKGSLYFSLGTAISETSGQIFDCSTSTRDTAQHVFAYWNGYSFGVLTTKNKGMSDLDGYYTLQCVHIGTYKVSDTGIYDIQQIFNGSEVSFQAKQPFLASINLFNQDPIAGYDATLYAYPTPGDLIGSDTTSEETFTGTVFLAENCIGRQYPNKASAWVTVHPVATRIIAAESEQEL